MNNNIVTFGIFCRKEKVIQLNEAPLYIRLSGNNKRKAISLKEGINIDFWDFENNKILPNYDRKEYLELLVNREISSFQREVWIPVKLNK